MLDEWVGGDESLGSFACGKDCQCTARWLVSEGANHQQRALSVELAPERLVSFEISGHFGHEVRCGLVGEHVFHTAKLAREETTGSWKNGSRYGRTRTSSEHGQNLNEASGPRQPETGLCEGPARTKAKPGNAIASSLEHPEPADESALGKNGA